MKSFEIKNTKGFTLIEIAIVLIILGFLIGLGASLVGVLTKRAKLTEAKEIVNAAVESVIGFAARENRLPLSTEFNQIVRNPYDPWNKPLVYFVDLNLTSNPNNPAEGICGKKTTDLIVCTDPNCTNRIENVAFIVVSGGPNYNVQTGSNATSCPSGKTCYRVYPQGTPNIDGYPYDLARPEEYDDVVKWITLEELRIKIGCQGSQLKILNNELPYGYVGSQYNATVYAQGGVPFLVGNGKYRWCVQGTIPSGITIDPNVISNDCLSLDETSWGQADVLTLTGSPSQQGSFFLTIFVRDNQDPNGGNDNIAQKALVLTINPSTSSTGGPQGAMVSFDNNINQFLQTENNQNAVNVVGNVLQLGGNTYSSYGCFWFPSSYQLDGKTMRTYFEFRFLNPDTSSDSRNYADGFTFAVVADSMPTTACGGTGERLGFDGLSYDSVAVEFDVYPNGGRNDPGTYNHIAIVKRGSVTHGGSTPMGTNPVCNNQDSGCRYTSNPTWLEDGVKHSVRIEIQTKCNPNCNNCGSNPQNYALIKAWVDCINCNDLTRDYSSTPTISHCFELPTSMSSVKFGFTQATGGSTQTVEISNFGIGFY
ncbi:prepilin-type N-terminal cleavage/methylation domain-containing protein [Thermodesulfobacterium thermophilum]|uniref:prepilin-type N-terminal cleavage/methylation domain-containing protein n=1 Tax=Thermodesulfobacterium thermophilum TaxID=886 RepID=UPI0003B464F0|nr:prepilin-type N-terminal cleavage/methylation domain-containing protein [Thermodesulfobacterium thermophilum]